MFNTLHEKIIFLLVSGLTIYLSFERLRSDSGLESLTDINGWTDYVSDLMADPNKVVFKAIFIVMIFTLVMILLVLKSFLP